MLVLLGEQLMRYRCCCIPGVAQQDDQHLNQRGIPCGTCVRMEQLT